MNTIEALFLKFLWTENNNDDLGQPHASVTDANVKVVQQVIQQQS